MASDGAERVLDLLDVTSGETLLIHGASGALGTIAVQLAVARGARVIGTAGAANQEYVTSLGATALVYGDNLVQRVRELAPEGVDACDEGAAMSDATSPELPNAARDGRLSYAIFQLARAHRSPPCCEP